jgi:hypothetical protein
MSIEAMLSTFITGLFLIKLFRDRYKVAHDGHCAITFFDYFRSENTFDKDILDLKISFKLPFVPFSIYKKMSQRCKELHKLGKDNSETTKKLILISLQLQVELRRLSRQHHHSFATPTTKKQLFKQVYNLVRYCEDENIKITNVFLGNEDIYEVMATLAKEI